MCRGRTFAQRLPLRGTVEVYCFEELSKLPNVTVTLPINECYIILPNVEAGAERRTSCLQLPLTIYHQGFFHPVKEEPLHELSPQTPVSVYSWPRRARVADNVVSSSCFKPSLPSCPLSWYSTTTPANV